MEFKFPENFLLGVASAATQIEGGEVDGTWHDWYRRGKIKDGSDPAAATEHWRLWKEDTELMAGLGIKICRLGIDWARLMPQEGKVSEKAVEHYRAELSQMIAYGLRPLLTIHHFTNPMWFERRGGFSKQENLHYFLEFTELAVRRFGDLVSEYITINEPNVYATNGYMFASWPPGEARPLKCVTVLENLCYCHIEAYKLIHRLRREMGHTDTAVGFSNHLRVFDAKDGKKPGHRLCARLVEYGFQGAVNRAMTLGDFRFPLKNHWGIERGEYVDFHGINYYSRSCVSGLADGVRENCEKTDLGWEIYPEGIVRCAEKMYRLLKRPLWVTENGCCDNTDSFRCRYIAEHLRAISESNLPFERYYHWCFCDNFEWLEGGSARFGLVHVDYADQSRSLKRSALFYREMIRSGALTEELWREYAEHQTYRVF